MALERFINWKPNAQTVRLVDACHKVLAELSAYRLTLRQLYYQLVSSNIIPNTERDYKKLSRTLTKARMAGLIDWRSIEDRMRQPVNPPEFADLKELAEAALASYRLPRWSGQEYYAELWVEKDALASVLAPLALQYHVTLMVNRGYSSASAMKEAADRFIRNSNIGKLPRLFYLGDMDPSGEDMVRDIGERLYLFGVDELRVEKIALTMEQVEQYDPPPNPAKMSDSRAAGYVAKHGTSSWEVDALAPPILERIISESIGSVLDSDRMAEVIRYEQVDKNALREAVADIMEGSD